ncbi:hypothetical protein FQR65_LT08324 [Abscondita terminalis]|nr:hypothetical protein FQR65_LT08324 [Abscondita terminalis]
MQYEAAALANNRAREEMATSLIVTLRGEERNVLHTVPDGQKGDYEFLTSRLEVRKNNICNHLENKQQLLQQALGKNIRLCLCGRDELQIPKVCQINSHNRSTQQHACRVYHQIRNKISLSLAMALSGLERNDWEDFEYMYDEGAKIANVLSRSTSTSSIRTSPSSESGIASISTDDRSPPPLSDEDFDLIKLEIKQLDSGKRILKYLESLHGNELEVLQQPIEEQDEPPLPVNNQLVKWNERNLLDLHDNITKNEIFFSPSKLPPGVDSYFNNRSQFSRLQGATVPLHDTNCCKKINCKFVEYIFN